MKKYIGVLSTLALLISCGPSLKVSTDYDKSVDFTKYKTFSLYKSERDNAISELYHDRIINSIRNEMIKKGLREDTSSSELLVNLVTILKDRTSVSTYNNYYTYGGFYRPYYWGSGSAYGSTTYDVYHYQDGSLIVDVIDASTNKLIWQGIGNKEIDSPSKDPGTSIPKAINSIMAGFPPRTSKK